MNKKNRLRLQAGIGILAAAAAVSSGLSAHATPAAAATRPVVDIVFWAGHSSGALHKAVVAEVAQFNKTHPSIHVTFLDQGASNTGIAAYLAHKAPNVAMIATQAAQQFISAGAVVNLDPYIHGKDGLSPFRIRADYYPQVWADMQPQNGQSGQYLMPLEKKSTVVLYYNEDLFKRAHIPAPPRTWAQVAADARKINALGNGVHGIEWTPSVRQFFVMTMDFGGKVWTDASQKTFDLNNPGARAALNLLHSLVAEKVLIPTQGYNYQLNFGTGKVGILIDASAGYTYDLSSTGGKFPMLAAPAPIGPSGRQYNYINGASLVMFNEGTPAQRQASWTFVKYMSSPGNNLYWDEHTNYLPLGPAVMKEMSGFYKSHPAYAASFSNPKYWVIKPRYAQFSAAKSAMASDFMKGLLGQETVNQALANMTADGNKYMSGQQRA